MKEATRRRRLARLFTVRRLISKLEDDEPITMIIQNTLKNLKCPKATQATHSKVKLWVKDQIDMEHRQSDAVRDKQMFIGLASWRERLHNDWTAVGKFLHKTNTPTPTVTDHKKPLTTRAHTCEAIKTHAQSITEKKHA